jgi:enamine deaminase RidA (YjgF/YER057c/UK114 family)
MVQNLKEWCGPNHRPVWTEVGVTSLGVEGMRIEIEVEAWIG